MTRVKEHFIELSCGNSRYLEAGDGPPLLLLHGMGVASSANAFDLILEQLREFMDHLGLEQVHLVGHSLGGWLGGLLAYQSPQRIERIVMLCAAGLNREMAGGVAAKHQPSRELFESLVKSWVSDPARLSGADFQLLVDGLLRAGSVPSAATSLDPLIQQMKIPELRERYMLHRRLPFITVPSLMVWGDSDPLDPYPTWTQEYNKVGGDMRCSSKPWAPPEAKFAKLPSGHYAHWELPEDTATLIKNFCR